MIPKHKTVQKYLTSEKSDHNFSDLADLESE